jgi:hypothetical protein
MFDQSFQFLFRGSQGNGRHETFDLMDEFQVRRSRCEPWIVDYTNRKSGRCDNEIVEENAEAS